MDFPPALGIALIISWMVGVISYLVWVRKEIEPELRKMITSEDPEEVKKAVKILYPPRFFRD